MFSEVPSDDVYNIGGGQNGAKIMIRYMKGLFLNGIDKYDLAKFTPIFNPSGGRAFDQADWNELMTPPAYNPYINTVKAFWGLDPIYREVTWWVPGEPNFEKYAKSIFHTVEHPSDGTDILYFAYK